MPMIRRVLETETSACYGKTRQAHEFYVPPGQTEPGDVVLPLESLDPKTADDLRNCYPEEFLLAPDQVPDSTAARPPKRSKKGAAEAEDGA